MQQDAIVILLFVLPCVLADGYPKETPDTPFNTGIAGSSQSNQVPDGGSGGYPPVSTDYDSRYRGPVAMLSVLPDGHIADTAEVTAARAAHLAALDKAKALWSQASSGGSQGGVGQGGSAAGGDGYSYPQPGSTSLGDAPSDSKSYLPPQGGSSGSGGLDQGDTSGSTAGNMPYDGPLAMLMVLPSGYLADTPDIAALRAAHLAALLKAQAAWKPEDGKQH